MMNWIGLVTALISSLSNFIIFLGDRQLIESGIAKQTANNLLTERKRIEEATKAREDALTSPLSSSPDGVLDNDGFKRD